MPTSSSPHPAAQYVHMSTQHRQYSLDQQSTTIRRCRLDELPTLYVRLGVYANTVIQS